MNSIAPADGVWQEVMTAAMVEAAAGAAACQLRNDVIYDAYVKYNEVSPWLTFWSIFGHTSGVCSRFALIV